MRYAKLSLMLGLLVVSAVAGEAALQDKPAVAHALAPTAVFKTTETITIDGKLDESAWKQATPVRVDYVYGKTGELSTEPRMIAKYLWDEHYLYIGYETFDKNLVAIGNGDKQGPPGKQRDGCEIWVEGKPVDVVEFFISMGDESFFWEIHQNAANQFNDIWCSIIPKDHPAYDSTMSSYGIHFGIQEYLQDEGPYTVATGVYLKPKADGKPSTVNDDSDVDTGYTGEIRIPWAALGAPRSRQTWVTSPDNPKQRLHGPWKMEGQGMPLLAVFQNGDLKDRYHHSSPTFKGGWFHLGAAEYPRYVLRRSPAP